MNSAPPLPEGTLVASKLRVVRLLGQGGMGAVYEVEHEFTKHRRALKLLHREMLSHPNMVERFVREASAAGRIGNQHIVETFDAGTLESGEPYLLMELLDGETLHARVERLGSLAIEEIADLLGQACDGVQAAHDAGIVHRDLKPDNLVRVERNGAVLLKVLDFGVSKFDPALTGAQAVTREGSAIGTPYYMSPEQVAGENVDARTDIYALGVILYECAAGRRPYEADALPKLSVLIHEAKPESLGALRPDLPAAFVELVARAMAKDRDLRPRTARELGEALAAFGSMSMGATVEEPVPGGPSPVANAGSQPPPARWSSRPGSGRPPRESVRPPNLASTAGSVISVERAAGRSRLRWLAAAGVTVAAGFMGYLALREAGPRPSIPVEVVPLAAATTSPAPPPLEAKPVVAPSSLDASLLASSPPVASAAASASLKIPSSSSKTGGRASWPRPAASSRVDERGLSNENPFGQ